MIGIPNHPPFIMISSTARYMRGNYCSATLRYLDPIFFVIIGSMSCRINMGVTSYLITWHIPGTLGRLSRNAGVQGLGSPGYSVIKCQVMMAANTSLKATPSLKSGHNTLAAKVRKIWTRSRLVYSAWTEEGVPFLPCDKTGSRRLEFAE